MKKTVFTIIYLFIFISISFSQTSELNNELLNTNYKYYKYNRYRNFHSVIELVNKGADINTKNSEGKTLLHFAAEYDNIDLVKLLYFHNADTEITDNVGKTAKDLADDKNNTEIFNFLKKPELDIYFYAKYGSFKVLKEKLNKNLEDINKPDKYGFTLLDHAVCRRSDGLEIVKFLVKKGIDLNFNYAYALDISIHNNNNELAKYFAVPDIIKKHNRPLNVAIDEHNLEMVELLVESGSDINGVDYLGYKPIIYALRHKLKNKDIILYLINKGADIHYTDWRNRNILHLLCFNNDEYNDSDSYSDSKLVENLLKKGLKINTADDDGKTALHYAAENPDATESLKILLKNHADTKLKDKNGYTPIDLAFQKGNSEAVKIFIENGADIRQIDNKGNSILHIAACNNASTDIVKSLLEKGIDINSKNSKLQTPLFLASENASSNELIEFLIKSGADVNLKDKYNTGPLFNAVKARQFETVKNLSEAGADINAKNNRDQTPLNYALSHNLTQIVKYLIKEGADTKELHLVNPTEFNNIELVKLLLSKNIDVNKVNHSNKRPLTTASENGFYEIAQLLITKGADINYSDEDNMTPLLSALSNNRFKIVSLLIDAGVDVKTRISDITPLHYAAKVNDGFNITKLLIEKGADVNAIDFSGMTPLHYALKYNNIKTANLLKTQISNEKPNESGIKRLVQNKLIMYDRIPLDSTHYDKNSSNIINKLQSKLYFAYENFNTIDLINSFYDKASSSNLNVYKDYDPYLQNKENTFNPKLSVKEINYKFGCGTDVIFYEDPETGEFIEKQFETEADLSEIDGLLSFDKWYYDQDDFKFYKDVISYCPIRHYYFSDDFDLEEGRYQQVAFLDFENFQNKKSKKKLIKNSKLFKKVKYEFLTNNIDSYFINENLIISSYAERIEKERSPYWNSHTKKQLIYSLTDKVLRGKEKAYDFETGRILKVEEIYKRFDAVNDTMLIEEWNEDNFDTNLENEIIEKNIIYEEIMSLIFIEDWYLDESNMQIRKEIIGIAPVRWYYPHDDYELQEKVKSIPFVVYFTGTKANTENTFDERKISISVPLDTNYMTLNSSVYNNNFYYTEEAYSNFNFKKEFTEAVTSGTVKLHLNYAYDQNSYYHKNTYETINTAEILSRIGIKNDTLIVIDPETGMEKEEVLKRKGYGTDSICILHAHENWSFDAENFEFKKDVYSYSPAIRFYRDDDYDAEDPRFKLIGYHINDDTNFSKMQLFKKVKFEFGYEIIEKYLYNGIPNIELDKPLFWNSYNQKNFKELIFDLALSGKVNSYDFETGEKLSLQELNTNLVLKNDTIYDIDPETGEMIEFIVNNSIHSDEINSFIFVENWYIDKSSFDLKKEVIGIAPVVYYIEDNIDIKSKFKKVIPFVLYFDEAKKF